MQPPPHASASLLCETDRADGRLLPCRFPRSCRALGNFTFPAADHRLKQQAGGQGDGGEGTAAPTTFLMALQQQKG